MQSVLLVSGFGCRAIKIFHVLYEMNYPVIVLLENMVIWRIHLESCGLRCRTGSLGCCGLQQDVLKVDARLTRLGPQKRCRADPCATHSLTYSRQQVSQVVA